MEDGQAVLHDGHPRSYEVIEAFGYTKTDEFGYISYTDEGVAFASKIFEVLNEVKDNFTDEYSFNIRERSCQSVPLLSCVRKTMSCTTTTINSFTPISGFLCRPNAPFRKNCGCAPFWMRSVPAVVSPTSIWSRISPIRIWHGRCSTRLHSPALSTLHLTPAINECKHHHGFVGTDHCPVCGEPYSIHISASLAILSRHALIPKTVSASSTQDSGTHTRRQ